MATADYGQVAAPTPPTGPHGGQSKAPLHRIHAVRLEQGMSLRSAARNMQSDVRTLRHQEQEDTDLRLSDLRKWQAVLDVPLIDLLEDPGTPLSRPVMERARMVRLMKTVMAIRDKAESVELERMAEMMVEQLAEIMPELDEVSPWHTYGQRRGLDEYGKAAERCLPEDAIDGWYD